MAALIFWTRRAENGYAGIVKYLTESWTEKEVRNFIRETEFFFRLLQSQPRMLPSFNIHKNLYRGPINKLTILTYRYDERKNIITLINIRDARKKPLK
jgi:plasmid stabilization system protein ParE